jgi:hypothetical protein
MLNKLIDDAYECLKGTWKGRVLIGLVCVCLVFYTLWTALPTGLKDRLFASDKPTFVTGRSIHLTEQELRDRNIVDYKCRGGDPHKQYELTRDLEQPHREGEMAGIVIDAVCVGDETFALEIFAKLNQADMRDVAAKGVTSFYINKRKFADASRWVVFLSNSQERDLWIRRILEMSQQSESSSK